MSGANLVLNAVPVDFFQVFPWTQDIPIIPFVQYEVLEVVAVRDSVEARMQGAVEVADQ